MYTCRSTINNPKWEIDEPEPRPRARVGPPAKTLDEFVTEKLNRVY
jgi:hypothetical protein